MLRVIEKSEVLRKTWEKVLGLFAIENLIMANVEDTKEILEEVEKEIGKTPVIFYGYGSEFSLRMDGHPVAPLFYRKGAGFIKMIPMELADLLNLYTEISEGKDIENPAVVMAAKSGKKKSLIGILLHDLYPTKGDICQKAFETAEREFGIKGTLEEVRVQLEEIAKYRTGFVEEAISDKVIPGIFCDVEGTLIVNNSVNAEIVKRLEEYSKTRPVTIWTGGELKEMHKLLRENGITRWPLVSKYDFVNCTVETMIDDLEPEKTLALYKIKAEEYIKV